MLEKEIKLPASESVWPKVSPNMNVKKIWKNLNVKFNSIDCENLDFKLRHNRIFTNVVIHQINKNVKRECDVCKSDPETLMHMLFECKGLEEFHLKLQRVVKENWEMEFEDDLGWREMFLFGVCEKNKIVNVNLLNLTLSHARYAVWCRRNLAHFEEKIANVSVMFESVIRKDVYLIYKYLGKSDFDRIFIEGSKFISVDGDGGLQFKF